MLFKQNKFFKCCTKIGINHNTCIFVVFLIMISNIKIHFNLVEYIQCFWLTKVATAHLILFYILRDFVCILKQLPSFLYYKGKVLWWHFFFYFCRIFMLKVFFERILYKNWLLKDRERKRGNQEWENFK